jgi:7-cyano-7-deazaguanine synthase
MDVSCRAASQPSKHLTRRAVCLVSGGMDSAVALAEARAAGFETYALSFDYGQRHRQELDAAARVARSLGAREHRVVRIDLREIGGSSLTDAIDVPKDRPHESIGAGGAGGAGIPATYVPARNTIFLSVALAWAEVLGAHDVFLGVNAIDYSGYPDCRPEFLAKFAELASLATAAGAEHGAKLELHAPLLAMKKADIVRRARELGVDLASTHTCYDPIDQGGKTLACGRCDACRLRLKGFEEAGVADPLPYAVTPSRRAR